MAIIVLFIKLGAQYLAIIYLQLLHILDASFLMCSVVFQSLLSNFGVKHTLLDNRTAT